MLNRVWHTSRLDLLNETFKFKFMAHLVSLLDMAITKECALYISRNCRLPPFEATVEKHLLSVSAMHRSYFVFVIN